MVVVGPPESNVALQGMEKSPQLGFISNIKDQTTGQAGGLSQDVLLPNVGRAGTKIAMLPPEILEQYERFFYWDTKYLASVKKTADMVDLIVYFTSLIQRPSLPSLLLVGNGELHQKILIYMHVICYDALLSLLTTVLL